MNSFICVVCEDDFPSRDLSAGSFKKAGTESRRQALSVLPESHHVCRWCEEEEAGYEEEDILEYGARVYDDPYIQDITRFDPGKWAASQQNW